METHDRRVKRTQNSLAQALITLTLEKGYDAVTIRDITDRADVGYATFFRHYHDKDQLLEVVLEVVLAELMDLLQFPISEAGQTTTGTLIFQYVRDHGEICRALLGSQGSVVLVRRIIQEGTANALRLNEPRADSLVPVEIAAHHLVAATLELIQWWLDHDMPYPPERMGLIFQELIARPTSILAFQG